MSCSIVSRAVNIDLQSDPEGAKNVNDGRVMVDTLDSAEKEKEASESGLGRAVTLATSSDNENADDMLPARIDLLLSGHDGLSDRHHSSNGSTFWNATLLVMITGIAKGKLAAPWRGSSPFFEARQTPQERQTSPTTMRFTFSTIIVALLGLTSTVAASWVEVCEPCSDWLPQGGIYLHAKCTMNKKTVTSRLDLRQCIKNDNGYLRPERKGGFDQTCGKCRGWFTKNTTVPFYEAMLACICDDLDWNEWASPVNLEGIVNVDDNAQLHCFNGFEGTTGQEIECDLD
ncbi:hypothetical protein B0T17DRAFT_597078 [Bombardia bombarda]|uniref:Cyanovirin-N domain-containing protein n=1 Tax=Bombardia bombarda TaxID=252184 RepID=A0AA39X7B9_9PEZI|nr:hypothetical protein B0T17DRAFT_597078 [Bombardia bombarda]